LPIVADAYASVVGVDTHARTHSYVILEAATGRRIAEGTFPASPAGIRRAITWITRRADGIVLIAAEGTGSYGAGLTRELLHTGLEVVEARPPKRAQRPGKGKSDLIDAHAAAISVLPREITELIRPRLGKLRSALRVLLTARKAMDSQRTADRNALIALARTIDLGIDARRPLTDAQIEQIGAWRVRSSDDIEQATARLEATRLARSVAELAARIADNMHALRRHVNELAPGLTDAPGIGPVTAAVFLTAYSHHGRVRSEAAFAALAGAAPIPASSGNTVRYRLSRHGDRRLNSALEIVARARLAFDPETRTYHQRRLAEGKTPREIRRMLKRYIARQVYRRLNTTMIDLA
jgi:transposase